MKAHDAVADGKFRNAGADFGNNTGHFMTEDAGRGMRAHMNFLEIGAADAAGGDLDEQLPGADARDGDGLQAHVVDATVDDRAHRGRDLGIDAQSGSGDLGSHLFFDMTSFVEKTE